MLFSFSFTDASLSFEKELTEAVRQLGYSDIYEMEELTILKDKLLVYLRNNRYDLCYLCIDLKTAEIKSVRSGDSETIYFGMLGTWYTDEDGWLWEKQTVEDKEKNVAVTNKVETPDDQITRISEQSDMWLDESYIDLYCAVTDLDQNGRLELIVSTGSQGSGGYTLSWSYQVDAIKTAFVDPKTGTYYYCVSDYLSAGAGSRYIWYGAMTLRDGLITERTYADGECTWNKKKTKEVWHYSRYQDGKEIKIKDKKVDIDSVTEDFFDGFEKKKVNISWIHLDSEKKLTKKKIRRMLAKSYKEFWVG